MWPSSSSMVGRAAGGSPATGGDRDARGRPDRGGVVGVTHHRGDQAARSRVWTTSILCSGDIRANTRRSATASARSSADIASHSVPVTT